MGEKARGICRDVILGAGVAVIAVFLIKKLFFLLLPVGMGVLFSELVRGSFRRMKPVSDRIRRILIILVLMILFAFLSLILVLAAEKLLEGVRLLGEGLEGAVEGATDLIRRLLQKGGGWLSRLLHRDVGDAFSNLLPDLLSDGARHVAAALPDWLGKIAGGAPAVMVSLIVFLFSGYYFSCEWDKVRALFQKLCPEAYRPAVLRRRAGFLRGLKKIVGAYGVLFLLTFAELFLGLIILRTENAVGKALAVALVDILPVLGSGTVLVPWGIFLLLQGKTLRGTGILILYILILLVRQFLEPRIVGRSIGLHPIVSLILMLGGLVLFGIWGMILLPLAAACLLESNRGAANVQTGKKRGVFS